jgi:hypothetical protein
VGVVELIFQALALLKHDDAFFVKKQQGEVEGYSDFFLEEENC